jgi:hypothetical protein
MKQMDIKVTIDPKDYENSHLLLHKNHVYVNMDNLVQYHKRFDPKTEARGVDKTLSKELVG